MKAVLITGASSGIGKACAEEFAKAGFRLLLCARRIEELERIAQDILKAFDVEILSFQLDVRNRKDVEHALEKLPTDWQKIDILVNNAGLARGFAPFQEGNIADWEEMIDSNIKGLLYLSRIVLAKMIQENSGHIINIGSLAGRAAYPNGAVYCATKAAVKILSDGMRMDSVSYNIRVTDIQPGLVDTNFSRVRFHGDIEKAEKVYEGLTPLDAEDVADAVFYAASRPKHVQINEILLTPTAQASSQVLHRDLS